PHQLRHLAVAVLPDIDKSFKGTFQARSHCAVIVRTQGQGNRFKPSSVVLLEQRRHQVAKGMRPKVRRHVSHPDPLMAVPPTSPNGAGRRWTLVMHPCLGTAKLILRGIRNAEE